MVEQTRDQLPDEEEEEILLLKMSFALVLVVPDLGLYPQLLHPLLYDGSDGPPLLLGAWSRIKIGLPGKWIL